MDMLCTTAFINELLVLPAGVSSEQQQLHRVSFVLFLQVVQPRYFQRNQDTSDLQEFSKVSVAARPQEQGEWNQKCHLPWSPSCSASVPCPGSRQLPSHCTGYRSELGTLFRRAWTVLLQAGRGSTLFQM